VLRSPEYDKPFELLAGHPALDFVNTLDERFDPAGPLELLTSYDRFLAFCEQAGILTASSAGRLRRHTAAGEGEQARQRVIELREALFALFTASVHGGSPPAGAMGVLNQVLRDADHTRVVSWEKPHFIWQTAGADSHALAPLWQISAAAADLLTSPEIAHISECGAETCRWLFLDRSRNHSRRWCDMKSCCNRTKARRFQARQHSV
jgi:predicted RNA-binding Zn ribbon-like protein